MWRICFLVSLVTAFTSAFELKRYFFPDELKSYSNYEKRGYFLPDEMRSYGRQEKRGFLPPDWRSSSNLEKRSYLSPVCARCIHSPSDWSSCEACYGRPGVVPFYGFAKRAFDPSQVRGFETKRAYDPNDLWETFKKKAFDPSDLEEAKRAFDPSELEDLMEKRVYDPSDLSAYDYPEFSTAEKRAYDPSDLQEFTNKRAYDASDIADPRSKRGNFLYCKCCAVLTDKYCCSKCPLKPFQESKRSFAGGNNDCKWCNTGSFDFWGCVSCTRK